MNFPKSANRKNALLFVISIGITLVLGELFVRIAVRVRNVGPTISVYDPYYGKRLKKSFSTVRNTPEFTMRFSTNSEGFRGPEPDSFPRRGILFLGDSFTAGYGVNDSEEFPALVKAELTQRCGPNRIPVVNAAMGNTGNGYWIKFLQGEGKRYEPRLIVLQFCVNDFDDNITDQLYRLDASGAPVELPPRIQSLLRRGQDLVDLIPGLSNSYLVSLIREALVEKPNGKSTPQALVDGQDEQVDTVSERLTLGILERVLSICEEEKWPVIALEVELGGHRLWELKELFERHRISLIVVPPRRERPDLYYRIDGHWNMKGHAFVSKLVIDQLFAENKLKQ